MAKIVLSADELFDILHANELIPDQVSEIDTEGDQIKLKVKTSWPVLKSIRVSVRFAGFDDGHIAFELVTNRLIDTFDWLVEKMVESLRLQDHGGVSPTLRGRQPDRPRVDSRRRYRRDDLRRRPLSHHDKASLSQEGVTGRPIRHGRGRLLPAVGVIATNEKGGPCRIRPFMVKANCSGYARRRRERPGTL